MNIYNRILTSQSQGKKLFSVLIDPYKSSHTDLEKLVKISNDAHVDYFLIGGSVMMDTSLEDTIKIIKDYSEISCILFPGSGYQITPYADGILLLSLISGRNPDLLIGKHVETAGLLRQSKLEILSTGYMLIEGGQTTAVNYMSHTQAIPRGKNEIAVATAMAGEMLGHKMIYLEAGSGANIPVSTDMISDVRKHISIPLIVGGGIRTPEKAEANARAGADMIVVGNAIEQDRHLIIDMSAAIHSVQSVFN